MRKPLMHALTMLGAIALLSACNASPPPAASDASPPAAAATDMPAPAETPPPAMPATPTPSAPTDTPSPADAAMPAFVGKTWRVETASAVEAGTMYTFNNGGALLIDAPHGTPMTGSWDYTDGKLTMTEEGIAYPTDIVLLDAGHFTIRSHNPGGVVEIAMVASSAK